MLKIKTIIIGVVFSFLLSVFCFSQPEYDGYILKFKDERSKELAERYISYMPSLFSSKNSESEEEPIREVSENLELFKTDDENLVNYLKDLGLLEYSEPDYYMYLYGYDYKSDPYYNLEWSNICANLFTVWDLGIYGNDVTVAVLDSGVNNSHADLGECILPGYNALTGSTDMTDSVDHGTKVCGVIAATSNNIGMTGVAHRAKIVPYKVADSSTFNMSVVSDTISRAAVAGADVINMSFGYFADNPYDDADSSQTISRSILTAVNFALRRNVIIVSAAGNKGNTTETLYSYPASFDGVISVANLSKESDGTYARAYDSQHNDRVTISAPGSAIVTTNSDGGYSVVSGTSFASPYVAGVAALAKSVDKNLTPAHFKELLISTANKSVLNEGETRNDNYGYGIIDAGALIKALIAEKSDGGFISPVDRKTNGEINVKISNTSSETKNLSLIAKGLSQGRTSDVYMASVWLAPGEIREYNLADSTNADDIKCYLLESYALRPMYKVIESLAS